MADSRDAILAELDSVIADTIFTGSDIRDLAEELRVNTWGISHSLAAPLTLSDLHAFLGRLIIARQAQVTASDSLHGMIFYLWHDVQASQLRFSLISDIHSSLPFKRAVRTLPDPDPILDAFLSDRGLDTDGETLPPLDVYTLHLSPT